MSDRSTRLAEARATRFESARQAALALNLSPYTYSQYENGIRDFTRHAERFAKFYRVNLDWLMTGRGLMRQKQQGQTIGNYILDSRIKIG